MVLVVIFPCMFKSRRNAYISLGCILVMSLPTNGVKSLPCAMFRSNGLMPSVCLFAFAFLSKSKR